MNEDFAATSTPARRHSNKGAAGAKPQELHHEDEFPQGGYYGYGKHANGSEFSKEHIITHSGCPNKFWIENLKVTKSD